MPIVKRVLKTSYLVTKNLVAGTPVALTLFSALKQCLRDVTNEDLPSLFCKIAFVGVTPVYLTVFIGAFANKKQFSRFRKASKILIKGVSSVYTGPAKLLDVILEPLEILFFEETCPIQSGNLFFIDAG